MWKQARQIDRRLHIEAVIEHLRNQMGMAHGLIMAAHDAERHDRAIGLRDHSRNDRVQRAFARGDPIPMLRIEDEAFAPIVE